MTWNNLHEHLKKLHKKLIDGAIHLRQQAREGFFKFKPFSEKQKRVLTWWCPTSPVKDYNGVIADGSIRSGKTLSMSLSFVLWAMTSFDGMNFAVCGKTIGALRRNVIFLLKLMLRSRGYTVQDRRTDNLLIIRRDGIVNYFYLFGGKDERSQDLIQGITLAGLLCDEVALMPESFVNQAMARCSVPGSKWWFNCNPQAPQHWFYKNWIKKCRSKKLLYFHFTMEDNLSLSAEIKERYRKQFVGVFYKRYILGLWVAAEGSIYRVFSENPRKYLTEKPQFDFIQVGVDFGGNKSAFAFVATGLTADFSTLTALMSERHPAEGVTPDRLYVLFQAFLQKVQKKYGNVDIVYVDSAEQTLKNGIADRIDIPVANSVKNEIMDRIRATTSLMAEGRFFYTEDCETLVDALCCAVYNEKKFEDERLDNGTSDIDTLDAFEYSWERYIKRYAGAHNVAN